MTIQTSLLVVMKACVAFVRSTAIRAQLKVSLCGSCKAQRFFAGYIGEDILSFGGSLETKLLFGVIEEETSEFAFKPSSGILGLAYNKPGLVVMKH